MSAAVGITAGGDAHPASAARLMSAAAKRLAPVMSCPYPVLRPVIAQSGAGGKRGAITAKDTKRHEVFVILRLFLVVNSYLAFWSSMRISSRPRVRAAPVWVPVRCITTPALFSSHRSPLPEVSSPISPVPWL